MTNGAQDAGPTMDGRVEAGTGMEASVDVQVVGPPSCAIANDAGSIGCGFADPTRQMCDDFDAVDEFTPELVNGGVRTLVQSPVSPPNAFAFTVPSSSGTATAAGQHYKILGASGITPGNLRLKLRMKLDASCANVSTDKEATIIEFALFGDTFRYAYSVRLAGLVPFVEARPQGDAPHVARGERPFPVNTWITIAEELTNSTAAVLVDCIPQASTSRGSPPPGNSSIDIYMGIDAPMGWSNCTITYDDLMINGL